MTSIGRSSSKVITMSIIVYNRQLKETDFQDFCDQIIFFKDSNIAYIIVEKENNYIMRKKKIFNNRQIEERNLKTISQILKIVN